MRSAEAAGEAKSFEQIEEIPLPPPHLYWEQNSGAQKLACRAGLDDSSEHIKPSCNIRNNNDSFVSTKRLKKRQEFDLLR